MSKKQKINLDELDDFQKEVYKNFGILPTKMEEVDNKLNQTDEELWQEEIRRLQFFQENLTDEEAKQQILEERAAQLIAKIHVNAILSNLMNIKHDDYLTPEETKQKYIENIENIREQMSSQKTQSEIVKQNPEKYLKQLSTDNFKMKKQIAEQSLKIRLLEKEVQNLTSKLETELNKTVKE